MKVVVVNPIKLFNAEQIYMIIGTPSLCPDGYWISPLDLSIAAQLKEKGYEVKYIDGDCDVLSYNQIARRVVEFGADYLVMNTETIDYYRAPLPSFENVNGIADAVSLLNPSIKIIVYGLHPVLETSGISENIDYVVKGEGDAIISKIITGKEVDLSKVYYVENLDSLPLPAYELAEGVRKKCSEYAAGFEGKFSQVVISRGCSYKCRFCVRSGTGKIIRRRSPEKIADELRKLKDLGYKQVYFIDDTWGFDVEWAKEVCKKIAPIKMEWACQTRVENAANKELIKSMKEAGCSVVGMGVESYNDEILAKIYKGITTEVIDRAVEVIKSFDLKNIVFLLLGAPGESYETIKRTDEFLQRNNFFGAGPFLMVPYVGTIVWKNLMGREGGSVLESLRLAGMVENNCFKDLNHARRVWRYLDNKWGKPDSVCNQIKKYRSDIWERYDKYLKELGEEILPTEVEVEGRVL